MKGISAIIATILLLLITISLAGTAYIFTGGMITGRTSKAISMVHSACKGQIITIIISNDGSDEIQDTELRVLIDDMDYTSNYSSLDPIAPHQTSSDSSDPLFDKGNHKVMVISPSNSIVADVYCSSGPCVPDCTGKNCGDDGCGGSCGSCSGGDTCCNFNCVDLNNDDDNCGSCGHVCGQNSQCSSGSCVCDSGYGNCDGNDANGCEINIRTNPNNCGSCGHVCGGSYCHNGYCYYYGTSYQRCSEVCNTHGGCASGNWDDDTSCTVCRHFTNPSEPCYTRNYQEAPCFWASNCYRKGSTPICNERYSGSRRICACVN